MSGKHQIGGNNIKLVKPSELSLDLISPNNMRNMGIKGTHGMHNNTTLGGPSTGTNNLNN